MISWLKVWSLFDSSKQRSVEPGLFLLVCVWSWNTEDALTGLFYFSSDLICYVANILSSLHRALWLHIHLNLPPSCCFVFLVLSSLFLLHYISFLLLGLCYSFLSSPLFSLFLPSGDAAKRKAWKLNRVGSLRSIYTNSLHNSEGKTKNAVVGLWRTVTLPQPTHYSRDRASWNRETCINQEAEIWWFAVSKDTYTDGYTSF